MEDNHWILLGLAVLCGLLWLMFQRWFWVMVFGLAALASGFTVLASIIHFQILGALGFFVLMVVTATACAVVAEGM